MDKFANIVIPPLYNAYTYAIPNSMTNAVRFGSQVEVPLGSRKVNGYVVGIADLDQQTIDPAKCKEISKLLLTQSFNAEQLQLFQWTADYYNVPLANVIDTAIPAFATPKVQKLIELINADITNLKGDKQKTIINFLINNQNPCAFELVTRHFKNCHSTLKSLVDAGYIKINEQEVNDQHLDYLKDNSWAKSTVELSTDQTQALNAICNYIENKSFKSFLLHGVTGSGKTEIYIDSARLALDQGLGVLVLVPEIALTPQLIARFTARLSQYNPAILHSAMSKRARWSAWQALLEGRAHIAIGARSAVFAPVKNLSLIIVDEEHDQSYKQADGLRYNARDLAVKRGMLANCPVVLGSATPSMESFHNALKNKYQYLSLASRHQSGSNISIQIVDLNQIKYKDLVAQNISPQLYSALKETLESGEQAFILFNRRGFASYYQCTSCGTAVECPNCSVTLTYHQSTHRLLCHYCNLSTTPSEFCNNCSNSEDKKIRDNPGKLQLRGAGTEKVFDEIRELFPQYPIARLDRDITEDPDSYDQIFADLRNGKLKILVGTQMIAKGHDLPNVTLVGIADSDVGLHLPDFRSAERVFQLLTQASGRAGRSDKPGKVILQTRNPKHLSIVKTFEKNYPDFAKTELRRRKDSLYPPYTKLLRIVASHEDRLLPQVELENLKQNIISAVQLQNLRVTILGPAQAPLAKLKTQYRWHILIKSSYIQDLQAVINSINNFKRNKKVKLIVDRDPFEML